MLKDKLIELLKHDFREIISSPLVMDLLSIYSTLFLHGSQPGYCEKCLTKYYQELKKQGMEKAERYELLKTRTLIPAWNGLKYIPKAARHFDSENITDEEACEYLMNGQLNETHFKKLPDYWFELNDSKPVKTEQTPEVIPTEPKQRKPRKKKDE